MKIITFAALASIALLGCSSDDDNNHVELPDQFEGLYLNESEMGVDSAIIANDEQGDLLLIDFKSNSTFVPLSFTESTNSIDYDQYKEGTAGSWTLQTGHYSVNFSGTKASSDQLGAELNKTSSEALGNISPDWNIIGNTFTFTSDNSNTYSGSFEWESDGYWELDDNFPFTDSSGQLMSSNAEIILFTRSGKTYSIIYDKQLSSVISLDIRL